MSATTYELQLVLILLVCSSCFASTPIPKELPRGFSVAPQSTTTWFQAILSDPTGNFSLGFLRMRQNQKELALAVVHVASKEALWMANPNPNPNPRQAASWSDSTSLSFNGSLVMSDTKTGLFWSSGTNGDTLVLLNSSNLQVINNKGACLWQSFDFPTNTLVQGQNLTSNMSLVSPNGLYWLQLGSDFMGLYQGEEEGEGPLLYWKHTALEAKAEIQAGEGPIFAQVNADGYLGMYQTSSKPVDVQKFNTFQQTTSFLLLRLEPDGNLRGYYWDGSRSRWVLNYQAIAETCDLPSPCGSYALCTPGSGSGSGSGSACSCLDSRTRFEPDGCFDPDHTHGRGDLCSPGISGDTYWVLRRAGVEPPHKELLRHLTASSLAECEGFCHNNCSCWGALYNNGTGFCYILDFPIQTMVGTGDESKVGYFKVRKPVGGRNRVRTRVGVLAAVLAGVTVIIGAGFGMMRWKRRKGIPKDENGASPGPYKHLGSASFRSIEMCNGQ